MSYDPNSVKARKGACGEKIVKKTLENLGYTVRKPADTPKSGASTVDFAIYLRGDFKCYAEVKVQAAYPFGVEDAPCYSFPVSRIEAYKKYGEKRATEVLLYVVDPESGMIYSTPLSELEKPCRIDAREFPFDRWVDSMGSDFRYFHQVQFQTRYKIDADELAELRNIDGTMEKSSTASYETSTADMPKQPEQIKNEFFWNEDLSQKSDVRYFTVYDTGHVFTVWKDSINGVVTWYSSLPEILDLLIIGDDKGTDVDVLQDIMLDEFNTQAKKFELDFDFRKNPQSALHYCSLTDLSKILHALNSYYSSLYGTPFVRMWRTIEQWLNTNVIPKLDDSTSSTTSDDIRSFADAYSSPREIHEFYSDTSLSLLERFA